MSLLGIEVVLSYGTVLAVQYCTVLQQPLFRREPRAEKSSRVMPVCSSQSPVLFGHTECCTGKTHAGGEQLKPLPALCSI
jgi:hypothetical protein